MEQISVKEITENPVSLIGDQWMLITAGTKDKFNTMTASWGGIGYLWNKPVAFIFVRPERYTFGFTEECDFVTLSFLKDGHRKSLNVCGSQSGRDTDKIADAGLAPVATGLGNIYFKEAKLVLECKKLYADFFDPEKFIENSPLEKWYGPHEGGIHKMYIVEIVNVWKQ